MGLKVRGMGFAEVASTEAEEVGAEEKSMEPRGHNLQGRNAEPQYCR